MTIVRLVHLHSQHTAVLHVTKDLIDAKADGLHVCVLLQMWSQYSYVVHGFSPLLREEHNLLQATLPTLFTLEFDELESVVIYYYL